MGNIGGSAPEESSSLVKRLYASANLASTSGRKPATSLQISRLAAGARAYPNSLPPSGVALTEELADELLASRSAPRLR